MNAPDSGRFPSCHPRHWRRNRQGDATGTATFTTDHKEEELRSINEEMAQRRSGATANWRNGVMAKLPNLMDSDLFVCWFICHTKLQKNNDFFMINSR